MSEDSILPKDLVDKWEGDRLLEYVCDILWWKLDVFEADEFYDVFQEEDDEDEYDDEDYEEDEDDLDELEENK